MNKNQFKLDHFISVYTNVDSDSFGLGYVIAVDENNVIIAGVTPNGLEDGLTLYKIENIYKIEEDTQYNNKILKLMLKKGTKIHPIRFDSDDILNEIISLSQNNERIVQVQLQNSSTSSVCGIIKNHDNQMCEIMQYDSFGQTDGICTFLMEDITSIIYDGDENRDIELLIK